MSMHARLSVVVMLATLSLLPSMLAAQGQAIDSARGTSTSGSGVSASREYTPPTGPAPRLPNGRPDFSGVWDHQYVPDMTVTNQRNPALQTGPKELPFTAAGLENMKNYNPERDGDYTGMCMP
jgi:hypothetical protein